MADRRYGRGQGPLFGNVTGPDSTDRGNNGLKRCLSVDPSGGPPAAVLSGANVQTQMLRFLLAVADEEDDIPS